MPKIKLGIDQEQLFADLGYKPHAGQLEIHRSRAPRRMLACGVRWGKSLSAAMEGIAAALALCDRSFGWVVAPTYELADKIFREIVLLVTIHLRSRIVKLTERELILVNLGGGRSSIRAKSADNTDSLLGEGLDWLIVDEAARLKPEIWQSHLTQRLIDKKGWALLISTPRGKGWFYDMYRRGQDPNDKEHRSWNLPSWSNPHLDLPWREWTPQMARNAPGCPPCRDGIDVTTAPSRRPTRSTWFARSATCPKSPGTWSSPRVRCGTG